MREMHGTSSRDDRRKRELQRQEREMAKFAQMYAFLFSFTNATASSSFSICFIVFKKFSLPYLFLYSSMQYRADAHKQEQQQEESASAQVSTSLRSGTALVDQDQRRALKFGFSSKGGLSKVCN